MQMFTTSVRPVPVDQVEAFDHETDAQVVILEQRSGGGGSSALSGGEMYLGGGTSVQRACGFDDSTSAMEAFLLAALGPDCDLEKVRLYCENSVAHFDWLVDQGVPFKDSLWPTPTWVPPTDDGLMWMGEKAFPFAGIATPAPRGHRVTADGFGGKVLMDVLGRRVAESDVDVHVDTVALRLVVDGDRVVGVIARHFDTTVTYRVHGGVVLTTGGFADNAAMLAEHAPALVGLPVNSDGGDDGRGIALAQAAGAAVRHMSAGQVGISLISGMAVRGMVVDRGRRFINEDVYPGLIGQAALFKHGLRVWVILDEEAFEAVPEIERWGVRPHFVAETLAELESEIGMPDGSLVSTVGEYNRHAENGDDPYFHKAPERVRPLRSPFAAIDVRRGIAPPEHGGSTGGAEVFTIGGLRTSTDGEVLDLDGHPVAGLYGAGRATSGLHSWGYISGTSLGDGTFFGRRAGTAAARRSGTVAE